MEIEHSYRPALHMTDVVKLTDIRVGDRISEGVWNEHGDYGGERIGIVVGVYPRFILLDFGAYKETRLRTDLYFDRRGKFQRLT